MKKSSRQSPAFLLRCFIGIGALSLSLLPAVAQTSENAPVPQKHPDVYNLEHYVHAVPASPEFYHPITAKGRAGWFVRSTVFPKSLVGGLFSAGIGTATNSPHEYGPGWSGFGQRYGMRLTGVSTGNAIEATLGSAWGEDPRYFHTVHQPFGTRVKNVLDLTVRAYRTDGERHLAYARYAADLGNNFLSNTWREPSEADWQHALIRSAEGIGARALSNAFSEFVPQVWRKVRGKVDPFASDTTP